MRGLKPGSVTADTPVAMSHLLQMRGLKPLGPMVFCCLHQSHLLQMRGLKLCSSAVRAVANVASFTDAWIETDGWVYDEKWDKSHLLQMRGLKHVLFILKMVVSLSHLLQMRGLKPCYAF